MKSNYSVALSRIKQATNKAELDRCETQITRLYKARVITASELSRLDVTIMEQLARLEN